jgi:hypothetical protein
MDAIKGANEAFCCIPRLLYPNTKVIQLNDLKMIEEFIDLELTFHGHVAIS